MNSPSPSRPAVISMLVIVIAMILLALYANVQRLRRDKIEKTTFTPATSTSPSPTAAP